MVYTILGISFSIDTQFARYFHWNYPLSYVDSLFYCLDGVRKCIGSVQCSGVSVAHANDLFLGVAQYRAMPNIGPPPRFVFSSLLITITF